MTATEKRRRHEQLANGLDRIDELLDRIDQAADRLITEPRPPQEDPDHD
jgi:hypothetical protein